jgi:hypothetical protein
VAAAAHIGSAEMIKTIIMSCGMVSNQSMHVPVLHALSGALGGHSAGVCPRSHNGFVRYVSPVLWRDEPCPGFSGISGGPLHLDLYSML